MENARQLVSETCDLIDIFQGNCGGSPRNIIGSIIGSESRLSANEELLDTIRINVKKLRDPAVVEQYALHERSDFLECLDNIETFINSQQAHINYNKDILWMRSNVMGVM